MVEKLNKIKNSKKGITLIALVVTIIVLLILASVSIAMLTGENGILKKATTSKEKTSEAEVEENISLATLAAKDDEGNFSQDLLIKKLEKYGLKGEKVDDDVIVTTDKKTYKIDIIDGRYDKNEFFEMAEGLENEPEKGKRCYKCYNLRLEETAKIAKEKNFDYFTTTLSLSPYKNSNWINEIGENLKDKYQVEYLYSDFKKKNGYKRSIELSKEYNLYRQNYCGCIYSKKD